IRIAICWIVIVVVGVAAIGRRVVIRGNVARVIAGGISAARGVAGVVTGGGSAFGVCIRRRSRALIGGCLLRLILVLVKVDRAIVCIDERLLRLERLAHAKDGRLHRRRHLRLIGALIVPDQHLAGGAKDKV